MLKIYVTADDFVGLSVYIVDEKSFPGGGSEIELLRPVGGWEKVKVDVEATPIEPTLRVEKYNTHSFLQSLRKVLDERGGKAENEFVMEGKLIATKKHLEDFRKLLFHKEGLKIENEKE